jgi:hypothetical protein
VWELVRGSRGNLFMGRTKE